MDLAPNGPPPGGRVHWPNCHPFITGWLQGLSRSYLSSFIENIWSPGAHQPHISSAGSWGASAGWCCWAAALLPTQRLLPAAPAEGMAQVGWGEIRRAPHSLWERGLSLRDSPSPGSGTLCALEWVAGSLSWVGERAPYATPKGAQGSSGPGSSPTKGGEGPGPQERLRSLFPDPPPLPGPPPPLRPKLAHRAWKQSVHIVSAADGDSECVKRCIAH